MLLGLPPVVSYPVINRTIESVTPIKDIDLCSTDWKCSD